MSGNTSDGEASGQAGSLPSARQLTLYSAVYPDTDPNILAHLTTLDIKDALEIAKEGNAGPELQRAYELAVADSSNICPSGPGERLLDIRRRFTAKGIIRYSKADATFKKHQSYNERFLLYLYENRTDMIDPEFARSLDDVDANVDYSNLQSKHRKYKGKKTLSQRKIEFRAKALRIEISDALGEPPGSNRPTVNFSEMTKDIGVFLAYLTEVCRKEDGGLHKAVSYTGQRASLGFLYRRYDQTQPPTFQAALTEAMVGAKNLCTQAQQHDESHVKDGSRPLT